MKIWGPHSVDCFASEQDHQLVRFHSRFWCPASEAVETFTLAGWLCLYLSIVTVFDKTRHMGLTRNNGCGRFSRHGSYTMKI